MRGLGLLWLWWVLAGKVMGLLGVLEESERSKALHSSNERSRHEPFEERHIAVLVGASTNNATVAWKNLPLFKVMLPSLLLTMDCGFRYTIFIGFSDGDRIFEKNRNNSRDVTMWLEDEFVKPMSGRGIAVNFKVTKSKLFGPAVIQELSLSAYDFGADFLYRVRDNTKFVSRWPKVFVDHILGLRKPYGVIGPSDTQYQSDTVLVHQFVHRTHMDIFLKNFFPKDLPSDEYLIDKWFSSVYGSERTFRIAEIRVSVSNFDMNYEQTALLSDNLRVGRERVKQYLRHIDFIDTESNWGQSLNVSGIAVRSSIPQYPNLVVECNLETGGLSERANWCAQTRKKYDVLPRKSRGRMSRDVLRVWKMKSCKEMFQLNYVPSGSDAGASSRQKRGRKTQFNSLPISQCDFNLTSENAPIIAVMSGSTSRNEKNPSVTVLSLFTIMLPSLIRSLDCGFRYIVVVGYDRGDVFYDTAKGRSEISSWFEEEIHSTMKLRGISIDLELVRVDNVIKKPGPVFLEIARRAYALGAEYMYRVNDDTEFHGRWPTLYSDTLMRLPKPYGVIGPRSTTTQNRILTHDFVHRTHMEIFEQEYYPRELPDWWMDDWITSVYGFSRTFMSKTVTVIHHVKYHGRRYSVNDTNQDRLASLVTRGRDKILEWMRSPGNAVNQSVVQIFDYERGFTFNDKFRYASGIGVFEPYFQIGGKGRRKKGPVADAVIIPSGPLPQCDNRSVAVDPLIAIILFTTSRDDPQPSVKSLSLFTVMLPSLKLSLECDFRYVVVLGYDKYDRFFDSNEVNQMLAQYSSLI